MISTTELRRLAGGWSADFTVVERDYVLSWVLAGLYRRPALAECLVFKGGTALRKCYFPDYRFSGDLDFTLRTPLSLLELQSEIKAACRTITEESGLQLVPVDFRTLRDVPGEEAHQGRIEYTGPLGRLGGSQPRIRLDLTVYEMLVSPPEDRPGAPSLQRRRQFEPDRSSLCAGRGAGREIAGDAAPCPRSRSV